MRQIDYIIIHCSATKSNISFTAEMCKEYHVYVRHYQDIGYHWYIERDGKIVKGRPEGIKGAHCINHNRDSIGVCYEGGLDTKGQPCDTRTEEQKSALLKLLAKLKQRYPDAKIVGHHDFNPHKSCPCFDARSEYRELQFV